MTELQENRRVAQGVALAPYTTYRIGGPADYFIEVRSSDELVSAIQMAQREEMPYFILGLGANILVTDKGFRGLVIRNQANRIQVEGVEVTAESGVEMAALIEQCAALGLSGFEHFAGIPSTVGGALWQNLHFLSPDRTSTLYIGDILKKATIWRSVEGIKEVGADYFEFGYDTSRLHDEPDTVVLDATFTLAPRPSQEIRAQIEENLEWRRSRHPELEQFPSCGSVFKKIEGIGAGRLIEQAGLKGVRVGGAQVSEKHANFIINLGGATASDVRALIDQVQERVLATSGYCLTTEIRIVGEL